MQLVMKRERTETAIFWQKFKINARLVCDQEEAELIRKYKLVNVILTPGNPPRDIRRAAWIGLFIAALAYGLFIHSVPGSLVVAAIVGFIVYMQIREEVQIGDIVNGRDFYARSLLQLLIKENRIRKMSGVFAIVIEQARTWHEPEVIQVEPKPLGILLSPTPEGDYEVT